MISELKDFLKINSPEFFGELLKQCSLGDVCFMLDSSKLSLLGDFMSLLNSPVDEGAGLDSKPENNKPPQPKASSATLSQIFMDHMKPDEKFGVALAGYVLLPPFKQEGDPVARVIERANGFLTAGVGKYQLIDFEQTRPFWASDDCLEAKLWTDLVLDAKKNAPRARVEPITSDFILQKISYEEAVSRLRVALFGDVFVFNESNRVLRARDRLDQGNLTDKEYRLLRALENSKGASSPELMDAFRGFLLVRK